MEETLNNENSKIIASIQAGGVERERVLKSIYNNQSIRRAIAAYVSRYDGFRVDVDEVFQETMIAFDRCVRSGNFRGDSSLENFIIGIGKHVCKNWSRRKFLWSPIGSSESWWTEEEPGEREPEMPQLEMEELQQILDDVLGRLGVNCRGILRMWALGMKMGQIANAFDLGGENNARKRKFRCLQSLMKKVKGSPATKKHLAELWKNVI